MTILSRLHPVALPEAEGPIAAFISAAYIAAIELNWMIVEVFADTNVPVYAHDIDETSCHLPTEALRALYGEEPSILRRSATSSRISAS